MRLAPALLRFIGFFGDYSIEAGGKTFTFELVRGKREYELR